MVDLAGIDVEEIATALADQTDDEHRWLLDPQTGQVAFWTSNTGTDGENPVEIDGLDRIPIDPIRS
jgi:hypothetical protein